MEPDPEPPATVADDTTAVQITLGTTYQSLAGFGTTVNPLVYPTGDYLGSLRSAAMEAAYGDVGLSLGAVSPGLVETPSNAEDPYAERGNDNQDPLSAEMAGFNFDGLKMLSEKVVVPADAAGSPRVLLGPFLNLKGRHQWMAEIRAQDYGRYLDEAAEHVAVTLRIWRDSYGADVSLIHLLNEPTSGNRSLDSQSVQEVVDLVARVGERLRADGFDDTRFVVPNEESPARNLQVAEAILSDPVAGQFVGAIGYHPYPYDSPYSSNRRILETSGQGSPDPGARSELEELAALSDQYGVPLWLTEVSEGPARNDYPFGAVENLLARAIHIHDNFLFAEAEAFFGMLAFWDSRSHSEHFGSGVPFLSEHASTVLVDVESEDILITGMGHAIGHYARWLSPGAVRVGVSSEDPKVLTTAFRSDGGGEVVLVVVNNTSLSQLVQASLEEATTAGSVTGETSTASERWKAFAPFSPVSSDEVRFAVPARSVTTVAIPIS